MLYLITCFAHFQFSWVNSFVVVFAFIVVASVIVTDKKGVLRTLSSIYDGVFLKKQQSLIIMEKIPRHRYLTGL